MIASRDTFISGLYRVAKDDPRIILISVDMGAPALDQWRQELSAQFLSAGISEQNAVNVAAGIADSGGIPVVYFMAVWTARCFEQIRYSCAMPGLPVTVLGNGVGLGYAPAGPAHEATEDLSVHAIIDRHRDMESESDQPGGGLGASYTKQTCAPLPAPREEHAWRAYG